ncbi:hypothetical protein OESDEN_14056 [Oesophagostomum dentatum]|uniref:Uncharacterized protein n=1 Tax=Oesophagostomum dentatum TaxID=61180 RepID=A0A0B1SRS3_OESDE|nr:hypothetical protein OESDEN_14056 [Oesophagostomum dentatum]
MLSDITSGHCCNRRMEGETPITANTFSLPVPYFSMGLNYDNWIFHPSCLSQRQGE